MLKAFAWEGKAAWNAEMVIPKEVLNDSWFLFMSGEKEPSSRTVQTCMLKISILVCIHEKRGENVSGFSVVIVLLKWTED